MVCMAIKSGVGNPWLDAGNVPYSTVKYCSARDHWKERMLADFIMQPFPNPDLAIGEEVSHCTAFDLSHVEYLQNFQLTEWKIFTYFVNLIARENNHERK